MLAERLKTETRSHHEAIEKTMGLMEVHFSLDDYILNLRRWKTVLLSLEPASWNQKGLQALRLMESHQEKLRWVDEDLKSLTGNTDPAGRYEGLIPYDQSSVLGAAYVLEGSTLGAQILSRHFGQKFGLTPEKGLRFYSGYGVETGPRWRQFMSVLREISQKDPQDDDKVVISAQLTFRGLQDSFS